MSDRKSLTLDELRKMNGKPVWVECLKPNKYIRPPVGWRVLSKAISGRFGVWDGENCLVERDYGTDWTAYTAEPPRINREAWEACDLCRSCFTCKHVLGSLELEACFSCERFSNYEPIAFCNHCGRPLKDSAWEILEKRFEVL